MTAVIGQYERSIRKIAQRDFRLGRVTKVENGNDIITPTKNEIRAIAFYSGVVEKLVNLNG